MSLITIPFLINEHYVLRLWLGEVPKYTDAFVAIILISSCVYSMSHTVSTAIQATGYVKWFQILLAATLLLEVPVAYIILSLGGAPYVAVIPNIFTCLLSLIVRIVILHLSLIHISEPTIWHYFQKCNNFQYCLCNILLYSFTF